MNEVEKTIGATNNRGAFKIDKIAKGNILIGTATIAALRNLFFTFI